MEGEAWRYCGTMARTAVRVVRWKQKGGGRTKKKIALIDEMEICLFCADSTSRCGDSKTSEYQQMNGYRVISPTLSF